VLIDHQRILTIVRVIWLVFCLYWFVRAFGNKRTIKRQSYLSRALDLLVILAAGLAISFRHEFNVRLLPYTLCTQLIGLALCVGGLAIAVRARQILGANWSGMVVLKENHNLSARGHTDSSGIRSIPALSWAQSERCLPLMRMSPASHLFSFCCLASK
jgi:hypothetical protein